MLGGHGRWEDGAAGDVGRTKMGLRGAPSGARSRTSGILFGWSALCVSAQMVLPFFKDFSAVRYSRPQATL